MPSSKVTSIDEIKQRRKQLKTQKRLRSLAAIWRTGVLLGLTGSLAWGLTLPDWNIHQPSQVKIVGNQLLNTQAIQDLLPLTYPQSLLRLNPEGIIRGLGQTLPVQRVTIARQLFPPTLIVGMTERPPVAMVVCDRCQVESPTNLVQGPASLWMMDAQGQIAPRTSYNKGQLEPQAKYPKVLGYFIPRPNAPKNVWQIDPERQREWQTFYPLLAATDVGLTQIDWRNQNNIVLQTRFGRVHLGAYSERISNQLAALKRLAQLPQYLNPAQLVHIDLVNPDEPILQMKTTVVRPTTSNSPRPGPTYSPPPPGAATTVTPTPAASSPAPPTPVTTP